jgi:hypothetical protein
MVDDEAIASPKKPLPILDESNPEQAAEKLDPFEALIKF